MAEQRPALPQAVIDQLHEFAQKNFEEWKVNATDEQKRLGNENLQKFMTDEEFKNAEMQKIAKFWADADVNGDGKLDLAEFTTFVAATRADTEAQGHWQEADPETPKVYAMINSLSEGEGFTMEEMMSTWEPWMEKFE